MLRRRNERSSRGAKREERKNRKENYANNFHMLMPMCTRWHTLAFVQCHGRFFGGASRYSRRRSDKRALTYSTSVIESSCHVCHVFAKRLSLCASKLFHLPLLRAFQSSRLDYITNRGSVARLSESMSKPSRECPREIYVALPIHNEFRSLNWKREQFWKIFESRKRFVRVDAKHPFECLRLRLNDERSGKGRVIAVKLEILIAFVLCDGLTCNGAFSDVS